MEPRKEDADGGKNVCVVLYTGPCKWGRGGAMLFAAGGDPTLAADLLAQEVAEEHLDGPTASFRVIGAYDGAVPSLAEMTTLVQRLHSSRELNALSAGIRELDSQEPQDDWPKARMFVVGLDNYKVTVLSSSVGGGQDQGDDNEGE